MYIVYYKNGIKMRVVDKEMQKVVQAMNRNGINMVELHYEKENTISVFLTEGAK